MSSAVPPSAAPKAARLAAEVVKPLVLSENATKLLAPQMTSRQFFDALAAVPALADDAVRFLAAALPKREAVWWGVLCLKEGLPRPLDPTAAKALATAAAWVKEPSEANRRAAGAAAEAAGYGTPAGCAAAAAFWSGGSLNPPHLPPVPPKEELTGTAVSGAILLATIVVPPAPAAAKARFLALGAEVASGKQKPA
jgi:hypothetical protein